MSYVIWNLIDSNPYPLFSSPVLSTGRAIAVGVDVRVHVAKMLKFLVKVFINLYLLKLLMDQVDTMPVVRY